VAEGKTKILFTVKNQPALVLVRSKDRITAGDGARAHDLEGKAAISTATNGGIYDLLNRAGLLLLYTRCYISLDVKLANCFKHSFRMTCF